MIAIVINLNTNIDFIYEFKAQNYSVIFEYKHLLSTMCYFLFTQLFGQYFVLFDMIIDLREALIF